MTKSLEILVLFATAAVALGACGGNEGSGGTGLPTCAAGQSITWDGTAWVCQNPDTLDTLAADPDVNLRIDVPRNPSTPSATLDALAADLNYRVRVNVAKNPNTTIATLGLLATDPEVSVRAAVAENPNLPLATVLVLVYDIGPAVRRNAAQHPSIPPS